MEKPEHSEGIPKQNPKGQRGPEWHLEDVLHFCRFGGKRAYVNDFFWGGGKGEGESKQIIINYYFTLRADRISSNFICNSLPWLGIAGLLLLNVFEGKSFLSFFF